MWNEPCCLEDKLCKVDTARRLTTALFCYSSADMTQILIQICNQSLSASITAIAQKHATDSETGLIISPTRALYCVQRSLRPTTCCTHEEEQRHMELCMTDITYGQEVREVVIDFRRFSVPLVFRRFLLLLHLTHLLHSLLLYIRCSWSVSVTNLFCLSELRYQCTCVQIQALWQAGHHSAEGLGLTGSRQAAFHVPQCAWRTQRAQLEIRILI